MYPRGRLESETLLDQVSALGGDAGGREVDLGRTDLLIFLKWDVSTDHVIEQNPQGPDSSGWAVVAVQPEPLGRSIDPGT